MTIPSKPIQEDILTTIHAQYADRFADPKIESRKQLARALFDEAGSQTDPDAKQYVLLNEAQKLAMEAGDLRIAFAAIDELAKQFEVDGPSLKLSTFDTVVGRPSPHPRSWLPWIQMMIDESLAAHRYGDALRVLNQAEKVGHVAERAIITTVSHGEGQRINELQAAWEKVAPVQVALKQDPNNPAACAQLGRFLCLGEGNWSKGLPLVVRGAGENAALKAAAEQDLSRPDNGASRLELAKQYEQLFHNETDPLARLELARRAAYWYRAARPMLIPGGTEAIDKAVGKLTRLPGFVPTEFPGAYRRVTVVDKSVRCLAMMPDGLSLIVACDGQPIKGYDIESGRPGREFTDPRSRLTTGLAVNTDGRKLVSRDRQGDLLLWRLDDNRRGSFHTTNGYQQVSWMTADLFVATETPDRILRVQTIGRIPEVSATSTPRTAGQIACLAASPGGRAAVGTNLGFIEIYALNLADRLTPIDAYARKRSPLQALAFAGSGNQLFAAYADGSIVFYDRVGSKHPWRSDTIVKRAGKVDRLIASPHGRQFVWTTGDNILHVGVRGKRETLRLEGHLGPIRDVAFLPDGWHVISVDEAGVVLRWSLSRD